MPVHGISGIPGHGKTSLMMEDLVDQVETNNKHEKSGTPQLEVHGVALRSRPLFASGIDGLVDGLVTDLPDPRLWNEVDFDSPGVCACTSGVASVLVKEGLVRFCPAVYGKPPAETAEWLLQMELGRPHAHKVPDGSKLYIDEAWKWFGHQEDARGAKPPEHVTAIAEHRHRGIDFVMTFQSPKQIYPFLRPLMGPHWHVVRRFGSPLIDVYQWGELVEEVQSQTYRDRATKVSRTLPTKQRPLYKSASAHTIKMKIPMKAIAAGLAVVVAFPVIYFVIQSLRPEAIASGVTGEGREPGLPGDGPKSSTGSNAQADKLQTPEEYAAQFKPRIAGVHGSQPMFDGRKVATVPAQYCFITGSGLETTCRCVTEQATPVLDVLDTVCRDWALHGRYDPFKAPATESRVAPVFVPDTPAPEDGPRFGGVMNGSALDVGSGSSAAAIQGK